MITNLKKIQQCSDEELLGFATTLHYVLYERDFYFKINKGYNEEETCKALHEELKKRGKGIEWIGFQG